MFDKLTYWKNRKAKKRGQGEPFNPVGGAATVGNKPVTKKAIKKNTKRARKLKANTNKEGQE